MARLEYDDHGYGLISTALGVPHSRQRGVERLNSGVYWSVLESGNLALLNFSDSPAVVAGMTTLKPYGLWCLGPLLNGRGSVEAANFLLRQAVAL